MVMVTFMQCSLLYLHSLSYDFRGFSGVIICRGNHAQCGMVMLIIVPVKEFIEVFLGLGQAAEERNRFAMALG
jgi:hypothetical protein